GPFTPKFSGRERTKFTRQYDIFYYMTDGSFFISKAKLNAVHFMIPLNQTPSLIQRLKLNTWDIKTANSFFTKNYLESAWKIKINYVHWGAVNAADFPPLPKQNLILNVGRFFSPQGNKHCKRQDFLVKTFIKMFNLGWLRDWRLILNGPIDSGLDNQRYADSVANLAKGYPITIRHQGNFKQLQQDYGQAKIYWHATGWGIDATTNPQAVEHFGLSTVEAMAAGVVPIVINQGGQPEIVTHRKDGLLWQTQAELINQTKSLLTDSKTLHRLATTAHIRSLDFSFSKFCQKTQKIFNL
ncbi:MAG: glycosyltransferase, partial [Candidatus Beckwithbacteria bacterium]